LAVIRYARTALLLLVPLTLNGCITAATIATIALVYGKTSQSGRTVAMNYHADLKTTWDAALAQLREMDRTPTAEQAGLDERKGRIRVEGVHADFAPLSEGVGGTRVEVTVDVDDYAKLQRARAFLSGTADRLGEKREAVHDFDADLKRTWEAAQAQLKAMELKTRSGTKLEANRGRIRVGEGWIDFEPLPEGGTRVRVTIGDTSTEEGLELARYAFEGMAERLGER
jgi:hypothetical protein